MAYGNSTPRLNAQSGGHGRCKFANRLQMMLVVLRDEEAEVDHGHRLLEARVKCGACEFLRAHLVDPTHKLRARC